MVRAILNPEWTSSDQFSCRCPKEHGTCPRSHSLTEVGLGPQPGHPEAVLCQGPVWALSTLWVQNEDFPGIQIRSWWRQSWEILSALFTESLPLRVQKSLNKAFRVVTPTPKCHTHTHTHTHTQMCAHWLCFNVTRAFLYWGNTPQKCNIHLILKNSQNRLIQICEQLSAIPSSYQTGVCFRTSESFFNRLLGPFPRDSGMELENVHVWQVPKWCLICESRDHTWIHHGWKVCWREFWPQQACYRAERPFQRDDIFNLSAVLESAGVVLNRKHQGQGWLIPSASYDTFLPCKMIWPRDGCQIS